MKILKQCTNIYNMLHYTLRALCVFIWNFAAAARNQKANYTLLVKPTCFFINSGNKKINDKFLTLAKSTLTILDKY